MGGVLAIAAPAGAPVAVLSARLLGDFELRLGDADIRPRSRKAAGLLAFLASSDAKSASRARLAGLLWSDRGDDQARSSLRQVIAELRAATAGSPGAVVITRDTIGFAREAISTDVDQLVTGAGRRDAAMLADCLDRAQGPFLNDLDGLSPGFDDWLSGERARQEERLFALVFGVAPELIGAAAAADLHRMLAALERRDPLNERVVRLQLRADHAIGDVAALHRRYRRLTDNLARDLGIGPSRETRRLFDELLGTTSSGPATLPSEPVSATRAPPAVLVSALASAGNPESGDIAAICTEDIRTALVRNRELRVLMIDASDAARVQAVMGNSIAAYRLSGRVRVADARTTVNVELGNIASGFVIWSEQLRLSGSPGGLTDEIVARVVGAIGPAIERDIAATLPAGPSAARGGREAALLYARGRSLVREARTLAAAREGAALLEAVIQQDRRHVGARMRLAQLYNTDFGFLLAGHDVEGFRNRARQLIEEAAALEPDNVRVQLRLAWCRLRRRQWELAERLFRSAIDAMPYDPDAIDECGFGLALIGELGLAEALMQRAFRLNPFAPVEYHADRAVLLALAGDACAAEEHFEVCGERRLLYLAVRLGNLRRLEPDSARLRALQRRFVDDFLSIWQPVAPPTRADLVAWLDCSLCFRQPEHRQLVLDGIDAAWAHVAASSAR